LNLGFGISKYYEDNRNLIVGVSNYFGSSPISAFIYQNDALGRRTERFDFDENLFAKTNTFSYNQHQEIDEATMGTNEYNYTYDHLGNRLFLNNDEYTVNDLNQTEYLIKEQDYEEFSFAHDLDGNMITNDVWRYSWNAENRMTSAHNPQTDTYITYDYDYQGRMVQKVVNAETNHFIWMGNHIIAELTDSSTNCYTWFGGETLTASLDGETVFYAHDANKNVTDLVDDSGNLVAHYEYSPFGVITEQTGTLASENLFRFSIHTFLHSASL